MCFHSYSESEVKYHVIPCSQSVRVCLKLHVFAPRLKNFQLRPLEIDTYIHLPHVHTSPMWTLECTGDVFGRKCVTISVMRF